MTFSVEKVAHLGGYFCFLPKGNKHPIGKKIAQSGHPGTDVMISQMFSPKKLVKILAFLLKLLLVFAKF
jgi:hypothetical protein